jgi:hypothetical protein
MVRRLHAAPGVYRSRASHEDDALVRLLCSQRSCRRLRSLPLSAEQSPPPPLVAMAAVVLCPQKPQLAHLHQRPQWAGEHHGSQALLEASRGCFGVQLIRGCAVLLVLQQRWGVPTPRRQHGRCWQPAHVARFRRRGTLGGPHGGHELSGPAVDAAAQGVVIQEGLHSPDWLSLWLGAEGYSNGNKQLPSYRYYQGPKHKFLS